MNDLEGFLKEILNFCSNRFAVFWLDEPITDTYESYLIWGNRSFKDFLEVAEKLNVKLIYLCTIRGEENTEHSGEIGYIELSFLHNGVFHVFEKMTDWFEKSLYEEVENFEPETEKINKEILEKSVDELTNEMISFIEEKFNKNLNEIVKYLDDVQQQFWLEKGVEKYPLNPNLKIKLDKVNEKTERYFMNKIREREEELLPKLVQECVTWCKEHQLKWLTKEVLKQFLAEKNIHLTPLGTDKLHSQVNNKLRGK